jgi:ribosomal protein S18 acetylase RimI-like enzyme
MDIQIAAPTPADAEGLQRVFLETWLDTYPNEEAGITRTDIEDHFKDALTAETLQKERLTLANPPDDKRRYFIAKNDERVVGVCGATLFDDFNKLGVIYVLPEFQRQGVGFKLWQAVEPFLTNGKSTIVHVASYNDKAIAFYQKLGFEDTGKRFTDERFRMKSGSVLPEMEMILRADK